MRNDTNSKFFSAYIIIAYAFSFTVVIGRKEKKNSIPSKWKQAVRANDWMRNEKKRKTKKKRRKKKARNVLKNTVYCT